MAKREFRKEVEGKAVESITVFDQQDGAHDLDVRFSDRTAFHIRLDAKLVVASVEIRDWSKGEGELLSKLV